MRKWDEKTSLLQLKPLGKEATGKKKALEKHINSSGDSEE